MYSLLQRLLFTLPTETSHHLGMRGIALAERLCMSSLIAPRREVMPVEVMGIRFPNPVGLAAGLRLRPTGPRLLWGVLPAVAGLAETEAEAAEVVSSDAQQDVCAAPHFEHAGMRADDECNRRCTQRHAGFQCAAI